MEGKGAGESEQGGLANRVFRAEAHGGTVSVAASLRIPRTVACGRKTALSSYATALALHTGSRTLTKRRCNAARTRREIPRDQRLCPVLRPGKRRGFQKPRVHGGFVKAASRIRISRGFFHRAKSRTACSRMVKRGVPLEFEKSPAKFSQPH